MDQIQKDRLLSDARSHLTAITKRLRDELSARRGQLAKDAAAYWKIGGETAAEDRMRALAGGERSEAMINHIERVATSPYFARIDLAFADEAEKPYYFGKFSYPDADIYSWTSPLASLRFEEPGRVSYLTPKRGMRSGELERKDQYMAIGDKLMFMTSEGRTYERQLVHQERLTNRKAGFMLPEIVAQMERAQDQVIRADARGPLAISGPAGSGKTTLALHRIAYLCQQADMATLFPPRDIIVFVNDYSTQDYFSHLLPELGINEVQIITFPQWAIAQLELKQYYYRLRPGATEAERDEYEWAKLQGLRSVTLFRYNAKTLVADLEAAFKDALTPSQRRLMHQNLKDGALDRYDLTLLLMAKSETEGGLKQRIEHDTFLPGGRVRTKVEYKPLGYALTLVDEFQNYLPEQLRLLRSATSERTEALLYVGDIAQRTSPGAMRDWEQIGETVVPERLIRLAKVYRNTQQILEYVAGLGYTVEIPEGITDGPTVAEVALSTSSDVAAYVRGIASSGDRSIGVLALSPEILEEYESDLATIPGVRCMTIREAQGVEFDVVCLVGITSEALAVSDSLSAEFKAEKQRITKDLLYVGLTRAISELHVLGEKLQPL